MMQRMARMGGAQRAPANPLESQLQSEISAPETPATAAATPAGGRPEQQRSLPGIRQPEPGPGAKMRQPDFVMMMGGPGGPGGPMADMGQGAPGGGGFGGKGGGGFGRTGGGRLWRPGGGGFRRTRWRPGWSSAAIDGRGRASADRARSSAIAAVLPRSTAWRL